jgi:hypothetical protein
VRSLTDFLNDLPGVMTRKARAVVLEGDLLSSKENADIHPRNQSFLDTVVVIGPDAAAAILAAYRNGRLPMRRGKKPENAPRAEDYLAKREELKKEISERLRRERAIGDPSLIVESDLTDHRLIDAVFITNFGKGPGMMMLAGIAVSKTIAGYKTNSGKNTGWAVQFQWIGSDGQPRMTGWTPPEAENRRNDADRDWGLHE